MSNYKTVYPVAGLGSRRENQSWNNFRDAWHKAGISGRRLKNVLGTSASPYAFFSTYFNLNLN
jgi:hypothetical protein